MKPIPAGLTTKQIRIEDQQGKLSTLEVEADLKSLDYLVAALQHHLKTALPLKIEFLDDAKGMYQALSDVTLLNSAPNPRLRATVFIPVSFHS